ncbi:hypothetical protein BDR05DRAFT_861212, partial [Suillus weaverae]
IIWYVPDGLSPWVQSNMYAATVAMGDLLKKSITDRKGSSWRTRGSNFRPSGTPRISPGCINIAPCWFQQGHEVSATLKGDRSLAMIMAMQRPALLMSAALCIMHPQLYWTSIRTHHWASIYTGAAIMCNRQSPEHRDPRCLPEAFDILTCISSYPHIVMQLTNLRIDLVYNPGVMVSYSGCLVRHGIRVDEGDQIVWAWFLRDSMHNYACTPRSDYAQC